MFGVQANNRMYVLIHLHMVTNGVLAFRHDVALHDKSGGLQIPGSYFEGALYCNALFNGDDSSVDPSRYFYAPWNGKNVIIKTSIVFKERSEVLPLAPAGPRPRGSSWVTTSTVRTMSSF